MQPHGFTRRNLLKGSAAAAVSLAANPLYSVAQTPPLRSQESAATIADRQRRMEWWHEATFGMFIHWGLYSMIGRQEWVMEMEGIPLSQYQILGQHFSPKPNAAREWARLARKAGQKYMVMTTKHHEGFCLFDSKLTSYCAPNMPVGRDLVREFVDAARAEGIRVGFYYSLMDWHHPDGALCATDEKARRRFVDYTHGLIRELMTNYGKIDVLWYDVDWPLSSEQWESRKLNDMVFALQPDIVINNRSGIAGDFSTPEQKIGAPEAGGAWESCMTLNDSWGYCVADHNWKSPETILHNLLACAKDGGNFLLNIGPAPDGSVPAPSVRILEEVGQWIRSNLDAVYGTDTFDGPWHPYADYTRKGNTLYMGVFLWPSQTPAAEWLSFYRPPVVCTIGGFRTRVKSVRMNKDNRSLQFVQDEMSLRITGLPDIEPQEPITVLAIECDGPPVIDHEFVRKTRQR